MKASVFHGGRWSAVAGLAAACALTLEGTIPSARADAHLSNLFGDNMVLQRDQPVPVWGQADPGERVTVAYGDARAEATADAEGNWSVRLPAMPAGAEGRDLTVTAQTAIALKNVVVGDVWLCSGQSNMEWGLGGCRAPEDVAGADFPDLRRIKLAHRAMGQPSREVPGHWQVCTPQTAPGFTGVGFYFARKVQKETGLPIGLIDSSWGGTRIEPWIPVAGFELEPSLTNVLSDLSRRVQDYRRDLSNSLDAVAQWLDGARTALANPGVNIPPQPGIPRSPFNDAGAPTTLYYGMITPLVPFAIKGALWYQGESNGGEGDEYCAKMRALIGGWRKVWAQGDFPFYFVQLANFQQPNDTPEGGDGWARLRMAQFQSLRVPRTGMAVAIDLADPGNPNDIHPKNKCDVGERLALWALKNDYGKNVVPSGPLYAGMQIEDGPSAVSTSDPAGSPQAVSTNAPSTDPVPRRIRIRFDHVGGGLMAGRKDGRNPTVEEKEAALKRFAIADEDKNWTWANAVIDGATVVVSSPKVPNPVAVRYAYTMNPVGANLYNREGLPASPFRTDDW